MCNKCCATCWHRTHIDDDTICCWHDPGIGIAPSETGWYRYTMEQARGACCDDWTVEIAGDPKYAIMDFSTWESIFHPEIQPRLREEYQQYVKKMTDHGTSDNVYIVEFEYPDVGGMIDSAEIKYTDRAKAIEAAVRESKRPYNEHVTLRHEWWCKEFRRNQSEWIDWEKEAKDGQAV